MDNRRKYIRISTVLPVEFCILDAAGKHITPWLQGFTHDIGKGGLCLLINDLWWGFWDKLKTKDSRLLLHINIPLKARIVTANAKVIWASQEKQKDFYRFAIGLQLSASEQDLNSLFSYALFHKFTPIALKSALAALLIFSTVFFVRAHMLTVENRSLVKNYVSILNRSSGLKEFIDEEAAKSASFEDAQKKISGKINSLNGTIKEYAASPDAKSGLIQEKINAAKKEIEILQKESSFLKTKQKEYDEASLGAKREFKDLEYTKSRESSKVIKGIYSWIKNRQDLLSGLVLSYEGDENLKKMSFTYDQALAAIAFVLFDDKERAEKIFDFYLKKVDKGEKIFNAYYTQGDCAEYVAHSGPNAWIGMAVLDYYKETGNKKYLPIAEEVSDFLFEMMDSEGGIKGGPTVEWYSTEHNLDAYAFFKSFYEVTKNEKYLKAAEKIKSWIFKYAYTSYGPPVNRGKGDSTIATDTYAWSVTAFGAEELLFLNMNPENILDFAVDNCSVTANFKRKEREICVKGFDFAKYRNVARGGVVSCEWTAQMVLSFEIMADYYSRKDAAKSKEYLNKSVFYSNELQKMLITSPSKIGIEDPCLPYASSADVDTGHGWRTPNGDRTGSLSSSAYFLIAYLGYNPLKGEYLNLSLKKIYETEPDKFASKTN
ncbi:MAG: PilZ domain-containing protein [Candidatus Omnitrophica bacterium]|nr:PilZ domain-containing protein [Candidatus Omnitrophota bacterium]